MLACGQKTEEKRLSFGKKRDENGGTEMIHSLSGGVLDGDEYHTLIKVEIAGVDKAGYYLCDDFRVAEGDRVVVEQRDGTAAEGTVIKVMKNVSAKCSPLPVKRMCRAVKKL